MNRKLFIINSITLILGVLLGISINFLTNDPSINSLLVSVGIGKNTLIGIVSMFTVLLIVLEYFKFRDQNTNILPNSTITQNQRTGNNSQAYQSGGDMNITQKK